MEENLLTILTSRWGQRQSCSGSDQKPIQPELDCSARPQAIALISSPVAAWGEALAQANLLSERLTTDGWSSRLVIRGESANGLVSLVRSFRNYLKQLTELMATQTVAHIVIDRPGEIWLTALPAMIIARFYGLPTVLNLLGEWPTKINPVLSRLLKPILGMTEQVWVSAGVATRAKSALKIDLHEIGPLVDLEMIEATARRNRVQPALLIDARCLDQLAIGELIAGCRLAKEKYPRTECTLLLKESITASIQAGLESGSDHLVKLKTSLNPEQLRALFDQTDIFLTGSKTALIDSFLLEAAAHGLPLMVGQNSPLTAMLKEKHQFNPLEFKNRSDLADLIIHLVEQPESVARHGWRAKALAEQFAWDNIIATIQSHYASVSNKSAG